MDASRVIDKALNEGIYLYVESKTLKYKSDSGGIQEDLKLQIREYKNEIISFLENVDLQKKNVQFELPEIVVRENREIVPVSYAQRRLWFIDQVGEGSAQYNMPGGFRLRGELDVKSFQRSVESIVERHEVLRTCFESVDGEAHQVIQDGFESPVTYLDISDLEPHAQEDRINFLIAEDSAKSFDLSKDILLRVQLIRQSSKDHIVLFNLHHIASDGWSATILIRELSSLYEAYQEGGVNPLIPFFL